MIPQGRRGLTRLTPEEARDHRIDRATLRRAWRFAHRHHGMIVLFVITIIASSVIAVIPPLVFKRLLDVALPQRDRGLITLLVVVAVTLAVAETALRLLTRFFSARIGEGLIFELRSALYDHVQRMPIAFFTRVQTGQLLTRLTTDVVGAQGTVTTMATVASDVFLLLATVTAMWTLSPGVTACALLIVPGVLALDRLLSPRMVRLSRTRMQLNGEMGNAIAERFAVGGALLVKLYGDQAREVAAFGDKAGAVRDCGVRLAMTTRLYYATLTLMGALGVAGVYWVGGDAVLDGTLQLGGLVALSAYVARLYSPLTELASARVDLLTALVSFERCFEVLDAPRAITERPGARRLERSAGEIAFEDVWFRYPPASAVSIASLETPRAGDDEASAWVLRGVSFTVGSGTTTALVGPSGAGKTTIAMLVARLYDVSAGTVRIDGNDVRDLTIDSVAKSVGVVPQDPHMFHESLAANLRYARPTASDAELESACRVARIHETIAALPDGYHTVVGERGYRLSGGERQRLAVARMLLKDPAIVVLDEATAHLDAETESLVQAALAESLSGRTAVVIAHRLSTVRAADQILVVNDGRVVASGTHDVLLAAGGVYRDLYEIQFGLARRDEEPAPQQAG